MTPASRVYGSTRGALGGAALVHPAPCTQAYFTRSRDTRGMLVRHGAALPRTGHRPGLRRAPPGQKGRHARLGSSLRTHVAWVLKGDRASERETLWSVCRRMRSRGRLAGRARARATLATGLAAARIVTFAHALPRTHIAQTCWLSRPSDGERPPCARGLPVTRGRHPVRS